MMKVLPVVIFFTAVSYCCGDIFRVSRVADKAAENTEQMEFSNEMGAKVLFIEKSPILADSDVKRAIPNYGLDNCFYVELTDEGEKKLRIATGNMVYGRDRLAIIIEGRVNSAPVVQAPLGRDLVISNLGNPRQVDDLARKITGRPPRPVGIEPPDPKPKAVDGNKGAPKAPPILPVIYPPMDPEADNFDPVDFVEGIKIADPKGDVNIRDLGGLISTTLLLEKSSKGNPPSKPTINANCDFIKALAHNFSDVAPLIKNATNGSIPVKLLTDVMSPYINGDKSWSVKLQNSSRFRGEPNMTEGHDKGTGR